MENGGKSHRRGRRPRRPGHGIDHRQGRLDAETKQQPPRLPLGGLCPRFIRRRRRFGHSPPRGRRGDKIKLFTAFPLGGRLFFIRPPGGHRFFLYSLFTGKKAPLSGCFSCYKTDQYASFSRRYSFSWLMGIRTCSMVSRSRTVTQLSPAFSPSPTVSKSTVMQ